MPLHLPFEYLHRPAASQTDAPWLLVLLHGVGSNEADLFGLAPSVPANYHVLSLRAPITLGPGAYAWFEFSVDAQGRRSIDSAQERSSRAALAQTLQLACSQLSIAASRVVVGGFSQGGIMALSLLLTQPQLMQGTLVMHSRLLPEIAPDQVPPAQLQGRRLWVSHGLDDQVIPLVQARTIRQQAMGWPLTLAGADFPGGHGIGAAEWQAVLAWLSKTAGS